MTLPARRATKKKTPNRFERIRHDHATELAEDYLELIDELITECGEARAVDIASRLGVTHVTVSKAVARLKRDGLVTSAPYRAIFMTEKGKRIAAESRRRHHLVLAFLRALGVPEESAQADAEGIEHHISPDTLAAMQRFIDRAR
ncbi:MAG TPA: manganese-binding transcriptional regulator MntR [Phycisphaerae bacterium]|nr:manganese-binding transcriptional regulator MntR [Phycisphaerales bacterium]HRX83675.1 manganese-binding transcriptional regulator MntR [Phycisphaerae bacterium]